MYKLNRKSKRNKVISLGKLNGLKIANSNDSIKDVIICDPILCNIYIKRKLDMRFKRLYNKIYKYLESDDISSDGEIACLDDIEKIKAEIFGKYKEYMKRKLYKEFLAKIVLTQNEFNKRLAEKKFFRNFSSYINYETKGNQR